MNLVFDSSALIAYLEDEPGADVVEELLSDRGNVCFVHSINLCEVFYVTRRQYGEQVALETHDRLLATGLTVREDMDEDFWLGAGRIKGDFARVSLADCLCVALANRIGGEMVTSDRHEIEALADAGACKVHFIR